MIWETLTGTNNDGQAFEPLYQRDMSFQVLGTFGGATIVLQGSNDGTNWQTLNDPAGSPISFTSAGLAAVQEYCWQYRPLVTGGSSVDIDAILLVGGKE